MDNQCYCKLKSTMAGRNPLQIVPCPVGPTGISKQQLYTKSLKNSAPNSVHFNMAQQKPRGPLLSPISMVTNTRSALHHKFQENFDNPNKDFTVMCVMN